MDIEIKNEVVSASAGTGKTFNLAVRYIKLLLAGVKPETIVALTFSRKAAGEIFDRIILLISKWIDNRVTFENEALCFGIPRDGYDMLLPILRSVLDSIHKLPIGTLDSFFVRIIKTFPFEFGLNGDFDILDDLMIQQAKDKIFKEILWEKSTDKQSDSFLEEFKQATFGSEEKKLKDLLNGFVETNHNALLETIGVRPWGDKDAIWGQCKSLLDLDIDIKKDVEILRPIVEKQNLIKNSKSKDKGNKFPAFFDMAESFTSRSEVAKELKRFFEDNLVGALAELDGGKCNIKGYNKGKAELKLDPPQCERLARIIRYILQCRLKNVLEKSTGIYQIIKRYETSYDSSFRKKGKLTFTDVLHLLSPVSSDDIPVLTNKISEEDKLYIDYRLDSSFDHWLLDEFQDTSYSQWMVIKNLIDEVIMDSESRKSFFYVGDTKQAIYGWRGGDATLFDYIHQEINKTLRVFDNDSYFIKKTSNTEPFEMRTMSDSWRSGPEVIETVNKVFTNMKNGSTDKIPSTFRDLWRWPEHRTNRKDIVGYSTLIEMEYHNKAKTDDKFQQKVNIIADEISKIEPFKRGLSVAVLVKGNKKGKLITQLLESHGIQTALEGNFSLDDNDVIKTILSLVKFAEHPGDIFAWEHLRMTPFRAILCNKLKVNIELLDDISNHGFAYLIQKWIGRLEKECNIVFNKFCSVRIDQLISVAQSFDTTGNKSCLDFIEYVKSYKIPGNSIKNAVQILTIHKSKGLEYDIVFMPDLNEKDSITKSRLDGIQIKKDDSRAAEWGTLLPERYVSQQDNILSNFLTELDQSSFYESLCVLYVGMTRASKALYMLVDPAPAKETESVRTADIVRDALYNSKIVTNEELKKKQATRLYEVGNAKWFEHYKISDIKKVKQVHKRSLNLKFSKRLIATTPSGAEKETVNLSSVFRGTTESAMNLGNAVHSIFEEFEDIKDIDIKQVTESWLANSNFADNIKQTAVDMFTKCVESKTVYSALSRPTPKSKIWVEKGFEVVLDNEWITGFFDRVTLVYNDNNELLEAFILDYKTDKVNSQNDINRALKKYKPQLTMYQKVLSRLTGLELKKIRKQLLLVRIAQIVDC